MENYGGMRCRVQGFEEATRTKASRRRGFINHELTLLTIVIGTKGSTDYSNCADNRSELCH